jgi:hypothetical protein
MVMTSSVGEAGRAVTLLVFAEAAAAAAPSPTALRKSLRFQPLFGTAFLLPAGAESDPAVGV